MGKASFLVLTGHDFRSSRKANVHFIAQEMAKRGRTRVFSVGFSLLSRLKKDPRLNLEAEANKVGTVGEVECFLWRTALHPFNLRLRPLLPVERYFFDWYVRLIPNVLRRWIAEATFIVIESGLSVLLFRKIKQINPKATVVYLASDDVSTINCSPHITEELERTAKDYDGLRLPSKRLLKYFQEGIKAFYVPHGMDTGIAAYEAPDPYAGGLNAVSIGSMLFDPTFFEIAAALRPDITFHVIGAGRRADGLAAANIKVYGEMPFRETIAYMRHGDIGIAPYEGDRVSDYLTDTSMKLAQYDFLGLPAVCPTIVVGDHASRFGYVPGDAASIGRALEQALAHGHFTSRPPLTWAQVTDRIIDPSAFPDTRI